MEIYIFSCINILLNLGTLFVVMWLIFILGLIFQEEKLIKKKDLLFLWGFLVSVLILITFVYVCSFTGRIYYGDHYLICFTLASSLGFFDLIKKNPYFMGLKLAKNEIFFTFEQLYINFLKKIFNVRILVITLTFLFFFVFATWYIGFFVNLFNSLNLKEIYGVTLSLTYFFISINLLVVWLAKDNANFLQVKKSLNEFYKKHPTAKKDVLVNVLIIFFILFECPKYFVALGLFCMLTNNVFIFCLLIFTIIVLCFWVNLPNKKQAILRKYNVNILQFLGFNHWTKPIHKILINLTELSVILLKGGIFAIFFYGIGFAPAIVANCAEDNPRYSKFKQDPHAKPDLYIKRAESYSDMFTLKKAVDFKKNFVEGVSTLFEGGLTTLETLTPSSSKNTVFYTGATTFLKTGLKVVVVPAERLGNVAEALDTTIDSLIRIANNQLLGEKRLSDLALKQGVDLFKDTAIGGSIKAGEKALQVIFPPAAIKPVVEGSLILEQTGFDNSQIADGPNMVGIVENPFAGPAIIEDPNWSQPPVSNSSTPNIWRRRTV